MALSLPAVEAVRPDYGGASVVGVVPALLGRRPASWLPSCVQGASAVVLLVLDGLGWLALQEHRARLNVLPGMEGGSVTTVAPSTTGAALTSITTGMPPADHGIVGYRMRVDRQILDVLRWRTSTGQPPPPPEVVPVEAFCGASVPVVTRAEFHRGGFSEAHLRNARFHGWRTTATLVERCRRLVASGEPLVFAYYDGIDKVAHEYGLRDGFFAAELVATDRLVGDLRAALPPSAAVLVTSDHGQVHFEAAIELGKVSGLVGAYAGDGRFRFLYAERGAARELLEASEESFGDHAWVLSREQLIEERWLGPVPPSPSVARRLGDVVLAARTPVAFSDPTHPVEAGLLAGHGSLTADEMLVPLVAGRGTGRA